MKAFKPTRSPAPTRLDNPNDAADLTQLDKGSMFDGYP